MQADTSLPDPTVMLTGAAAVQDDPRDEDGRMLTPPVTTADASPNNPPHKGKRVGDLVVRDSGILPYSGRAFVMYRHCGRQTLASQRTADAVAAIDKRAASETEVAYALLAQITRVADDGRFSGVQPVTYDDLLDMDADDANALALALYAEDTPTPR